MSIVEKPTSHSANHTFDNNGRIENGYYNGNCMESPSLPIPSIPSDLSFMSDGYRDDLESAPKCCGADDEYSTKSSKRRRKKNGSLKRAAKRIEDLDRSLSISLEELLQGVNATKSPLHPSNESLAFISPVVSPNATKKFSISPQLPQNDLLITEEDFDSLPISRNPIEVEPCDRPKRTSNSIIDGNDDATIIVKENDDVFRKREHGFSLPCFKSDSNNKQIIPGGDLNTKVPVTKNKDQFYSNAAKNKLHNNSCSPQVSDHKHVNNVAPPNTLNINLCAPDNTDSDLSPTSLEVGHILEHAYSENDLIDVEDDNETDYVSDFNHNDTLSSILGAKPKKHAAYSTPEYCKQLSSLSLEPIEDGLAIATQRDDEKLKLCRPRCAKEIQSDILVSGCVTFPGCYDLNRRPVLFVHCDVIDKSNGIGTIEIARLMLYFVSNSSYVTLLISQASEDTWEIVKKSVILFQENRPGVLSRIIVFSTREDFSPSVHELKAECSTIHDKADLLDFLTFNNLPDYMGGNMLYNHAEWVKQRMDVESYVLLCERLQHSFANHSLAMTTASLPASLDDTTEALNKHRSTMTTLLDDERIRDLHNQGHRFLKFLQSEEKHENRSYAEQIQSSYEAVCSAIQRYVQSADERLLALEKHVLVKQFEESCDRIVTWAADRQDELQEKFGEVAESLNELRIQRQQFDCFYLEVVKQYAQCDCLLSEANQLSSSGFLGQVNSQAINAAEKISQVVQDMEMKKEEVESASQLFLFVDQAYSWALAGMKFVASLNMKDSMTTDELQELIQKYDEYMTSHPPIPEEEFARMQQIAAQFKNVKCQRQCEVAQQKCVEIGDLFMQRRKLIKKARDRQILELQKKEVEVSPENNNQDDEIIETNNNDVTKITETNDTNSEKSIKPKTRAILRQSSDVSHRLVRPNGISNNSSLTNGTVQTMHGLIEAPLAPLVSKPRPKKMLRKSQSMSCHHGKPKIGAPMRGEEPNTQGRTKWSLAIEELITTEEDYVKSLNYIIEHYYPMMNQLEDVPQALRGKRGVVFGNIENICDFHAGQFLDALRECYDQPARVAEVFIQHRESFGMYALYSKNKPRSDELMSEHGTKFFRAKQHLLRDKMDLASYLLKPAREVEFENPKDHDKLKVQRMGKYALLLHNIAKHSEIQHRSLLKEAESLVKFQLRHGNDLLSMDSIVHCDVNLKEQGELLRQDEFLVFHGRRKFVRHVFLFEDLILFSKPQKVHGGHDVYHYKSSHKTAEIGLTENIGDSGMKFEVWFRRPMQDSMILLSNSEHKKQSWVDEIRGILWKQALKNKANRRNEMANMGVGSKPHLDISSSESPITERSVATERLMGGRILSSRSRASIAVTSFEHGSKRPHSTVSTSSTSSNGSFQLGAHQPASMFDFRAILEGEEYESGSGQGSSICMSNSEPDIIEKTEGTEDSSTSDELPQQYITTV